MVYDPKAYKRAWFQTPHGKKVERINKWSHLGLKHDDMDALYDLYLSTTHCDVCEKQFKNNRDRCMDHDHDTGLFRQILCRSCNTRDHWKFVVSARTSCVAVAPELVPSVA